MITTEQATDLIEFLIRQLNNNGFGDIGTEINTRLVEEDEADKFYSQPHNLLEFILEQSIEVLENLSNKEFQGVVNRLNEFITGEKRIETIGVEILNPGEQTFYNLMELPNYEEIISTFREILIEVRMNNQR